MQQSSMSSPAAARRWPARRIRRLQQIAERVSQINDEPGDRQRGRGAGAGGARVDRNLVAIRDIAEQSADGASQTSSASDELARLATDLNGMCSASASDLLEPQAHRQAVQAGGPGPVRGRRRPSCPGGAPGPPGPAGAGRHRPRCAGRRSPPSSAGGLGCPRRWQHGGGSRSRSMASRLRMRGRSACRASALSAARPSRCSSSRTLPGQWWPAAPPGLGAQAQAAAGRRARFLFEEVPGQQQASRPRSRSGGTAAGRR